MAEDNEHIIFGLATIMVIAIIVLIGIVASSCQSAKLDKKTQLCQNAGGVYLPHEGLCLKLEQIEMPKD